MNEATEVRGVGPLPLSGQLGMDFFDAMRSILSARDAGQAMSAGLEMLAVALAPGFASMGLVWDGDELVPADAACLNSSLFAPGSYHNGTATKCPTPEACLGLHTTPARVRDVLAQLAPESRELLIPILGKGAPSSLLVVRVELGQAYAGYIIVASHGSEKLTENDRSAVLTVADLVATVVDRINLRSSVEEARTLKTEIISALSHQMRTPLASIRGYATALLLQGNEYDQATRQEFLEIIDEETGRLSALIGDLLESSAIEAGLLHIEYQPVLLPRLARQTMKEVAQRNGSHKFVVSFPSRFPVIHADPGRLKQVLHNLLDNAVKYSPDGGLIFLRGAIQGDEAIVSVADQGVGIAPEHLNRLFERFFRVKGNLRRPVSGAGLGLPIARAIVEAHGGRIWAESTLSRGSTFYFTLPLKRLHGDDGVE